MAQNRKLTLDSRGDWAWSVDHAQVCQILEAHRLWDQTVYRVWLPRDDVVVRVRAARLESAEGRGGDAGARVGYHATSARVAAAVASDGVVAPIGASVIPLPHQIRALSRGVGGDAVRYLLADEVGLGKTIEAGLILRELKLRGLVRRTLVVAPKGLVTQWVGEMWTHFGETFQQILPSDLPVYRRISGESNPWRACDQVVCPVDAVKPVEERRGWSARRVAEHNQERFEDLVAAGWDLVIVDEAHRLGGSTDQVARYKLGRGLAEASPHLLLLSATPHQGKSEAFHRLVSLLDEDAFPDLESVSKERVAPYVIRTEKRQAIDAEGQPLFQPRTTRLEPVAWGDKHSEHRGLYEAVTEYVREGYNQAVREKRNYVGFLMLLMQRLVTSSTQAIRTMLERRLEILDVPDDQLPLFPEMAVEEWAELDGQEQLETTSGARVMAVRNERAEVYRLLEAARRSEQAGPDAKAEALLDWIYRLQREEGDPSLKVLVFTEFVPTQEMLRAFLADRGFKVVCLNGSMGMEERGRVQEAFSDDARVLVSTDAGGEGINLQFCHVVINYDIPWNPMRLEQRIGRVDRIGQAYPVRAVNFALQGTVEHRVQDVLEQKLGVILEEFGVDKTADILDSAQAERIFDALYMEAILEPEKVEPAADQAVEQVRNQARAVRESASVLGQPERLDPAEAQRLLSHPLPHWVERMTVSYLRSRHGADRGSLSTTPGAEIVGQDGSGNIWKLRWPDGFEQIGCFTHHAPGTAHLGLDEPRIRELVTNLPRFAPGQPIPVVQLSDLPSGVRGYWSLWKISLHAAEWNRHRIMPLFVHDDGRRLGPTARAVWETLCSDTVEPHDHLAPDASEKVLQHFEAAAKQQGETIYRGLLADHRRNLEREREKGQQAFAARRRAIERIGLPEVREHRLGQLAAEEAAWRRDLDRKTETMPDLVPVLIVRVDPRTR